MPGKRGRHARHGGGRATPKGTQPRGFVSPIVRAIFEDAAEVVHDDPADAEVFASSIQVLFREPRGPRPDDVTREALRVGGLVGAFVARGANDCCGNAASGWSDRLRSSTKPAACGGCTCAVTPIS